MAVPSRGLLYTIHMQVFALTVIKCFVRAETQTQVCLNLKRMLVPCPVIGITLPSQCPSPNTTPVSQDASFKSEQSIVAGEGAYNLSPK